MLSYTWSGRGGAANDLTTWRIADVDFSSGIPRWNTQVPTQIPTRAPGPDDTVVLFSSANFLPPETGPITGGLVAGALWTAPDGFTVRLTGDGDPATFDAVRIGDLHLLDRVLEVDAAVLYVQHATIDGRSTLDLSEADVAKDQFGRLYSGVAGSLSLQHQEDPAPLLALGPHNIIVSGYSNADGGYSGISGTGQVLPWTPFPPPGPSGGGTQQPAPQPTTPALPTEPPPGVTPAAPPAAEPSPEPPPPAAVGQPDPVVPTPAQAPTHQDPALVQPAPSPVQPDPAPVQPAPSPVADPQPATVPAPAPSAGAPPTVVVTLDGHAHEEPAQAYIGPVAWLRWQHLGSAADETVLGTGDADFLNLLGGTDAADGRGGDDVLDGGTGSNFLTGGGGKDTFFLDGRGGATTWSTVTDWQSGEGVSIWGWRPGVSRVQWVEGAGAEGFRGATLHADLDGDGRIETSVTFAGHAQADLPAPVLMDGLLWFA